jgi:transglutaminase-like putative cysteine protease
MIDGSDEQIIDLAKVATRGEGRAAANRAEAMRRFVGRYVRNFDFSVGFASASEVARTRQGDCTEHAVLLAAMLKADGIPARVVNGLVYIEAMLGHRHVFGYHMWTQAWIDGRWVDLDATLDRPAFDAAHIALSASDLDDGVTDSGMIQMLALFGRLSIDLHE